MCQAGRVLLEPMQNVHINCPQDMMGDVTRELQGRRSTIEDIHQDHDATVITAKAPVAEMFGFASAIRGATQGRALWSTENSGFVKLPGETARKGSRRYKEEEGIEPPAL